MSPLRKSKAPLIFLPVRDPETGDVTVVLETPKGSHNKYKYDPSCGALRLSAVLGEGLSFPYDFGFVPSTLGADGDPLDVLLFLDHAVPPGSIVTARMIGVLEIRQRKAKESWIRNDRFFAVEAFFVNYAGLEGKKLEVLERKGPNRARKLLKAGMKQFASRIAR